MRLWLNRTGEVSLREQLITQVELAILCKELLPGERLPSTRELARRFGIHANTASAAYRDGAGARGGRGQHRARKMGAAESLVRARLRRWLQNQPPSRWLVIEPDPELCAIVIHEMELALALPVSGCTSEECNAPGILEGSMFVVLPSKAAGVRKLLPAGSELTVLDVHPVAPELLARLQRYLPEHAGELIGIASRWKDFQRIARTMLVAAGLDPESLLVRDATQAGWKRGLDATAGVVCDSVTALELPAGVFPLRFTLLDEPTLAELRRSEQRVLPPA